jgi:serine/threonine-protein kinase
MTPHDHLLLKELLLEALLRGPAERRRWLGRLRCSPDLRRELLSLLSFSEDPAQGTSAPPRLRPSQLLAQRYVVEHMVGRGGASEVYSARDLFLGRRVAVKALFDGVDGQWDRLLEEERLARRVRHPGVCRVIARERHHDLHFLVLELVEGEDLATRLARSGALTSSEVAELGHQLATALAAAHDASVLHGDLKPANLLLDRDGTLRVTDFGVASCTNRRGAWRTRSVRGTAAYMAPEAFDAERELTTRSDLYSMGAVLYELVTGARVFPPADADILAEMHRASAPMPPSRLAPQIDRGLERLILRLLAKDADDRPRSAREVVAALAGLLRDGQIRPLNIGAGVPAIPYGVSRVTLTDTASV